MKLRYSVLLFLAAGLGAQTVPFDLFCVSDLTNVFADGYRLPERSNKVDLFGIRDEILSAQVVVFAKSDLKNVSVVTEKLVSAADRFIPAGALQYNFVESVPLTRNSDLARGKSLLRPAPALFPDYLSKAPFKSIVNGNYQAIWLTLHIPKDASPGTYSGIIKVTADRGSQSLPIQVQVYPLEMPKVPHLYTTNWYSLKNKYHDFEREYDEKFFKLVDVYARAMSDHRQNVYRVELSSISANVGADKNITFDYSNFDRWVKIFERTGTMARLETGFVARFVDDDWWSTTIVLREFNVFDRTTGKLTKMKGEEYLPQFLPAFEKHLKEAGWLEKTVFHIADEPSNSNIISWREASYYVHKYAPSLKRIEALEGTFFDNRLEVWVPKLDHLTNMWESFKKAQRDGNELWYYLAMATNGYPNRFTDSPVIESRILHWLNYRFGITGYLHWGLNQWSSIDPYQEMNDPSHGIGSNALVYPLKDGILSSIRWEQERNGLSDYEYFWLLEQEIAGLKKELGPHGDWIKPEQRGVELASQVITTTTDFSHDPSVLYSTKKEILNEILDFQNSPRLYVQTTPRANSRLIYGQILLEITGWTEPGSSVTLNDKDVPVSAQGEFRTVIALFPTITKITVTSHRGSLSKTVDRNYSVTYPNE